MYEIMENIRLISATDRLEWNYFGTAGDKVSGDIEKNKAINLLTCLYSDFCIKIHFSLI